MVIHSFYSYKHTDRCFEKVDNTEVLTDPSHDVPLGQIVDKMLAGQYVAGRFVPQYDIDLTTGSIQDAFLSLDPTRTDGFDLADVPEVRETAAKSKIEYERIKNEQKKADFDKKSANTEQTKATVTA